MRLTFKLGEEASRNACYSKQLCQCLFSTLWASSLKSWHLLWGDWKVTHLCRETSTSPPHPVRASFLPARSMARLYVLVSAGMFGPLVQIGQSVPSLLHKQLEFHANKPRKKRNVPTGFDCNRSRIWTGTEQQQEKTQKQSMWQEVSVHRWCHDTFDHLQQEKSNF